jgi:hypothetical protein
MPFLAIGLVVGVLAVFLVWGLGTLTGANLDLVSILGALIFVLGAFAMSVLAALGGGR